MNIQDENANENYKFNNYLKYQNDLRGDRSYLSPNRLSSHDFNINATNASRSIQNTNGSITSQELRQNDNKLGNKIQSLKNRMDQEFKDISNSNTQSEKQINSTNNNKSSLSQLSNNHYNNRYKTTEEILNTSSNKKESVKIERSFTLKDGNKLQLLSGTDQSVSRLSDNYNSPMSQGNSRYNTSKSKLDLTSPASSKNEKDIQNYQKNISFYRNIIEQMQSEISKLNNKLVTLEQSKSEINTPVKQIQIEQRINEVKFELEMKLKLRDEEVQDNQDKLFQIQTDNKLLLNKNTELEEEIKKLESLVKGFAKEMDNKNVRKMDKPPLQLRAKSEKKFSKDDKSKSKNKFDSKTNKPLNDNVTIKLENEALKNKLKLLKTFLSKHRKKVSLDELELTGKDNMMMEIAIWKNREETLINKYFHIINSFKQQIKHEKDQIIDSLNKLTSESSENVEKVVMKYEEQKDNLDEKLCSLIKENDELKVKFSRLKNIVSTKK